MNPSQATADECTNHDSSAEIALRAVGGVQLDQRPCVQSRREVRNSQDLWIGWHATCWSPPDDVISLAIADFRLSRYTPRSTARAGNSVMGACHGESQFDTFSHYPRCQ